MVGSMPNTNLRQIDPVLNKISLSASSIFKAFAKELVVLFEQPTSTTGAPWHIDDYDHSEGIHAELYRMGDYYGIFGLSDLALSRAFAEMDTSFDAQVNKDAVQYLMRHAVHGNERIVYPRIASAIASHALTCCMSVYELPDLGTVFPSFILSRRGREWIIGCSACLVTA